MCTQPVPTRTRAAHRRWRSLHRDCACHQHSGQLLDRARPCHTGTGAGRIARHIGTAGTRAHPLLRLHWDRSRPGQPGLLVARTAAHGGASLWQAERVRMAQDRALAVPPAALPCPLPHGRPRLTVPFEHLLSPVPLSLVPLSSVPLSRIPLLLVPLRPVPLTAGLGYRADRPSGHPT
jgi:hypothetical protein